MLYNYLAIFNNKKTQPTTLSQSGFGLIELLVSISIMVIIASVIFARQGAFNGAILLRNQAYEIALQAREVQLSAVSVNSAGDSANNDGNVTYRSIMGLHFDTDQNVNGFYNVYKDSDSDNIYDTGEEFGFQGILDPRFEIRTIQTSDPTDDYTEINIVFERPNFDAKFFDSNGNEIDEPEVRIGVARRDVEGDTNDVIRYVEITSTGQISIQN